MTLYVVRHAESEANERDILASRKDFPLSGTGARQAVHVAAAFMKDHAPEMIITSPLIRAKQTGDAFVSQGIINDHPPQFMTIREELTEQELGRYAGMTYKELETAEGYEHDRTKRWDWVPEGGGESYSMVADRLVPFFEWLDRQQKPKEILVVTHAVTMRMIRAHLEMSLPDYPQEIARNGEVWKIEYRGFGNPHEIESLIYDDSVPERRA